jgi:serine/threonine-protein kinase RsbW
MWPKRYSQKVMAPTATGYADLMSSRLSEIARPARLTLAGAARPDTVAEWRHALKRWLQHEVHTSAEIRDDVVLGVNEALANCVEHAYRSHHQIGAMKLQASYDPAAESIRVCVSDRGNWQRPSSRKPNDPRASRGLALMHSLADKCTIHARPNGTSVYLDYAADTDMAGRQQL